MSTPEPRTKRPYTRRTQLVTPGQYNPGNLVYVDKPTRLFTMNLTGEQLLIEPNVALVVVGNIQVKKMRCVVVRYMGREVIAEPRQLAVAPSEYFYISSTGTVGKSFIGKNPQIDDYRRKVRNYYHTREKAQARLDVILGVNKPLRATKAAE